jgi:uncharacterized damage-inducible protein DinB
MTTNDLTLLLAFNRWANDITLRSAEALSDEQLRRDLKSSFPSVFATLVHMYSADWVWLERWQGRSPSSFPDAAALTTLEKLRAKWKEIEASQRAFLGTLDNMALERKIAFRNLKGIPFEDGLGFTFQHVVNHATYHRGQITTMLRQLGATPVGTDFIDFVRQSV